MTKTYCDLCGAEIPNPESDGSKLSHTRKWNPSIAWESPFFSWPDICVVCTDHLQRTLGEFARSRGTA